MRPLTKVILVLFLVALAVGVLFVASRNWTGPKSEAPTPVASADRPADQPSDYSDPVATYQRWRDRMAGRDEGKSAPGGGGPSSRDLASSSRDEGKVIADRLETPVAGADPPGPVLRPDGVAGDVVTGPLRTRESEDRKTYTVVSGDTLYGIAVQRYGDAKFVQTITAANPGIDPNRLKVGDRLVLPEPEKAPGPAEKAAGPQAKRDKVYVVQKSDTLIGIARRVYGDGAMYPKIYEANKDVLSSLNARLYVGMRLRLPEPQ